jgi:hypothetical protein
MSKKNPVGRPPISAHLLKKRTTKTIRIPVVIADYLKELSRMYGDGAVSISEIKEFIDSKREKK